MKDKILNMLGLAEKAGKVVSGEFMTEKAVGSGKATSVILAADASENTRHKFTEKCSFYKVPVYVYSTKNDLGHAIGREERSCMAVCDRGFSDAIGKLLGKL